MQPVPLVRQTTFAHSISTMERLGVDTESALSRAGLQMWHYGRSNDWIPFRDAVRVMDLGARVTGDPQFGLKVGDDHKFSDMGILWTLVSRSVSTYDVIRTLCNSINAYNSIARYWLSETEDIVWICRAEPPGIHDMMWQMEQYTVRELIRAVQLGVGQDWRPEEVRFCEHRAHGLRETDFFADIQIGSGHAFTAIPLPKSLLSLPLHRDRRTLSASPRNIPGLDFLAWDFIGSLRKLLESLLGFEKFNINVLGEILGVSTRSLQRELARQGTTYRKLVGQARYTRATEYLNQTHLTIEEIAHELGYTSKTNFSRAFRYWSGISPSRHRRHRSEKLDA